VDADGSANRRLLSRGWSRLTSSVPIFGLGELIGAAAARRPGLTSRAGSRHSARACDETPFEFMDGVFMYTDRQHTNLCDAPAWRRRAHRLAWGDGRSACPAMEFRHDLFRGPAPCLGHIGHDSQEADEANDGKAEEKAVAAEGVL